MLDGESVVTVTVTITDDDIPEPNEVYYLFIYSVSGGDAIVDASRSYARLTILANDDPNGVFGFASPLVYANELSTTNPVALTVLRSRGSFGVAAVNWRVVNGADRSNDLAATSGFISFADMQTLQVGE